jgi:hypothetical protein
MLWSALLVYPLLAGEDIVLSTPSDDLQEVWQCLVLPWYLPVDCPCREECLSHCRDPQEPTTAVMAYH